MEATQHDTMLVVIENRPLSLRAAHGTTLTCIDGIVWLTQEGNPREGHLRRGHSHLIESDGLVLIEGSPRGSFLVTGPPYISKRVSTRCLFQTEKRL